MEKVFVMVKPDGVERAMNGRIISVFEEAGLKLVGIKILRPDREIVERHYTDDESWLLAVGRKAKQSYMEKGINVKESEREIGIRIRSSLLNELTRGNVVAMVFEGNSAVEVSRKLAGGTEPRRADPSTIRGRYSCDSYALADKEKRPVRNLVHVSESSEIAEKEIALWFGKGELVEYKRADEDAMYKV
jgi:nucleoside-diphosphate kinase